MNKITCDVIGDLLPLYCDDVCSQDSRELVREHLENCRECSALLGKMKKEWSLSDEEEQNHETVVKDMAAAWRRSIRKSFLKGALIMLCVCSVLAGSYLALTRLIMVAVPADEVEITVDNVTEQYVKVILKTNDGKKISASLTEVTADGKYYIILKRGVIPVENGGGKNWEASFDISRIGWMDSGETVPITEIYYGTGKDSRLIWSDRK